MSFIPRNKKPYTKGDLVYQEVQNVQVEADLEDVQTETDSLQSQIDSITGSELSQQQIEALISFKI